MGIKKWIVLIGFIFIVGSLVGCAPDSKEEVIDKISEKWEKAKGYEVKATMNIQTGAEPREYHVEVWHTKPSFYRVQVESASKEEGQTIIRNDEGVFVVSPSLGKTYKFQSDWPKQNSQAYLISSLAEDIRSDKKAKMTETKDSYIFVVKTRNSHSQMMPTQKVTINKKTWLPKDVSILDEVNEEKIHVKFDSVKLNKTRDVAEFKADMEQGASPDTKSTDTKQEGFETRYPVLQWSGVNVIDEKTIERDGVDRVVLTFGGEKEFTIIQTPAKKAVASILPVMATGDPADLGFAIGAITDHSVSWESDGISFLLASQTMSKEEMIQVASSMRTNAMK